MSLGEDLEPYPQPDDHGGKNNNPRQGANTRDPSIEKMIYYRIESRIGRSLMKPEPLALFLLPRRQY
ncbi:MAG: hypothetical protein RQ885_12580, partial [Desulfurococcales archaeon]|nr:hypothetical protein [Desulfurococcales archaeon]